MLTQDIAPGRLGRPVPNRRRKLSRRELAGRYVLVADGDPGTRAVCRQALQGMGLDVDVVDSGVEALGIARKRRPDLIFIDLQLRDALGIDVIGWLRSIPSLGAVPIIAMSAVSEDPAVLGLKGARMLLRKPLSPDMVTDAVRAFIEPVTAPQL